MNESKQTPLRARLGKGTVLACAFVPPFVKCFQTWPACDQMHFPHNFKKNVNESKQTRLRAWLGQGTILACMHVCLLLCNVVFVACM